MPRHAHFWLVIMALWHASQAYQYGRIAAIVTEAPGVLEQRLKL
eukprot:COSAG02_NODE_422_length_22587_cov_10.209089_30_plen_44_part_00